MASNNIKINAVIVLGGAFNPIHTQHIEIMNIAKKYLETEQNFNIEKGFLAPAPQGYVLQKMKNDLVIDTEHRINICNSAALNSSWIQETKKCYGSALSCALDKINQKDYRSEIVVVVGADRAANKKQEPKWRKKLKSDYYTVFVGRSGDTDKIRALWKSDLKLGNISNPDRYFFIDIETQDVSSTKIRFELNRLKMIDTFDEKVKLIQDLINKNYLNSLVGEYILKNEKTLYLENKN
jgi:nicotinic acid mononucleotide adenylyltransferase